MKVRLLEASDQQAWDAYVEAHASSSPYHRFAWCHAVDLAYGHKNTSLLVEAEDQIVGVLPLVCMKRPFGPPQLVSLPFCDLGAAIADKPEYLRALVEKAIALSKNLKANLLELRSVTPWFVSQGGDPAELETQVHKVRMVLSMPETSKILWDGFKSKLRSQVRKAEKNGCEFSWASTEACDDFYHVFSLNMRDLGSPVHSKSWFESIVKCYGANLKMGFVRFEGELIGVGILLENGEQVSIPWASTLRSHNHLSPNMMLYWHMLEYAADHGCRFFDFGRSSPNEGTYRFKAQWGAVPVPLYWHQLPLNGQSLNSRREAGSGRALVEKVWQKLPLPVANCIGPVIRKQISL